MQTSWRQSCACPFTRHEDPPPRHIINAAHSQTSAVPATTSALSKTNCSRSHSSDGRAECYGWRRISTPAPIRTPFSPPRSTSGPTAGCLSAAGQTAKTNICPPPTASTAARDAALKDCCTQLEWWRQRPHCRAGKVLRTTQLGHHCNIRAPHETTSRQEVRCQNYTWFGIAEINGLGGVGFLVSLYLAPYVTVFNNHDQKSTLDSLTCPTARCVSVSVYMPQESSSSAVVQEEISKLSESIAGNSCKGEYAILGDFNAKLARPQTPEEVRLIGPHDYNEERTRNGSYLASLIVEHNLTVMNGHSVKESGERWHTWSRTSITDKVITRKMSTLDLLLTSQLLRPLAAPSPIFVSTRPALNLI